MSFFHRGGPGTQGQSLQIIAGKVVQSGAVTGMYGAGTMTAAWDSDASCVVTWAPSFKAAGQVKAIATPTSAGAYTLQATGVAVNSCGFTLKLSSSTASGFGFDVLLIGQMNL